MLWQPTPVFLTVESPRTEEPGRLQSLGSPKVRYNWVTKSICTHNKMLRTNICCYLKCSYNWSNKSISELYGLKKKSVLKRTWTFFFFIPSRYPPYRSQFLGRSPRACSFSEPVLMQGRVMVMMHWIFLQMPEPRLRCLEGIFCGFSYLSLSCPSPGEF